MTAALDLREPARRAMPAVEAPPGVVATARATWLGRMVNEHASSRVFDALAAQLADSGFSDEQVASCARFADEERTHGVLCGAVVEALGGDAVAPLPDGAPFPRHPDVAPREGALRNVLSVCCLSETVAVALIGAERLEMPQGELRALLERIWADEVGHARFGWKLVAEAVPALDAAARVRLGRYLAVAFGHLEAHELAHLPEHLEPPPGGAAVGVCSGRAARRLFYDTVESVIVVGLERLGLPARDAWEKRRDATAGPV